MDFLNFDSDDHEIVDENINQIVTDNTEKINNNNDDRYLKLIKLLDLNENINYPHNILVDGIIQLHTTRLTQQNYHSKFVRNITFKKDEISKKINDFLFGYDMNNSVSYVNISRQLRRIYRHYKYNKIVVNIDNNKNNNIINNENNTLLGFNYQNPRWSNLDYYDI